MHTGASPPPATPVADPSSPVHQVPKLPAPPIPTSPAFELLRSTASMSRVGVTFCNPTVGVGHILDAWKDVESQVGSFLPFTKSAQVISLGRLVWLQSSMRGSMQAAILSCPQRRSSCAWPHPTHPSHRLRRSSLILPWKASLVRSSASSVASSGHPSSKV